MASIISADAGELVIHISAGEIIRVHDELLPCGSNSQTNHVLKNGNDERDALDADNESPRFYCGAPRRRPKPDVTTHMAQYTVHQITEMICCRHIINS